MSFGRVVKLYVGNFHKGNEDEAQLGYDLSGLDIEFDVTRSIEWYDNEATITIYNPRADTVAYLMNNANSIMLQAGYDDESVGNIFVGQIAMVEPRREGADIVVKLTCLSARGAFYQLARLNCAVSFSKGTGIKECLQTLCDYGQIVLRAGFTDELSEGIKWPFTCSGTFLDVIRKFSEKILFPQSKFSLYVDNNEMIVFGRNKTIQLEEITIDYEHGLLTCHEIRDEKLNKVNFGDDPEYYLLSGGDQECPEPKKRPSKEIDRTKEIEFSCLMNPAICPNVFVNVDSYTGSEFDSVIGIQGRFIVTDCRFNGSNFGSDFTVLCKAQEAPVISEGKSRVSFNRGAQR